MNAPHLFTRRFTNRYGEEWEFVYDSDTSTGILRGADVDWDVYPVVGGSVQGLILNEEEIAWLQRTWVEAIGIPR
jgi:hypothetical protein